MIKNSSQIVTFQLGNEHYGIDIMQVEAIVPADQVHAVPNSPPYLEGIFNLRGTIVPVINLHKHFSIAQVQFSEEDQLLSGLVIVRVDNLPLAIMIDRLRQVVTVGPNDIQPAPYPISFSIGSQYIQGVIKDQDQYLIVLHIGRLFNPMQLADFHPAKIAS